MKNFLRNLIFLFIVLFICLAAAEGALRLAGMSYTRFHQMDYYTAHTLRPGAHGWFTDENRVYAKINSRGLRDREHEIKKPENTIRIAVLGDSYAEALHVPMENAFWAVAEKLLNNCENIKGKNVEFINFGVGGYGTDMELIALRRRVWEYEPDIVLLAFLTGNDVKDNYPAFNVTEMKPYFKMEDGKLVPDYSFRDSERYRRNSTLPVRALEKCRDISVIFQLLDKVRLSMKNKRVSQQANENMGNFVKEGYNPFSMVYIPPESKEWIDAWDITEKMIVQMRDEVEEKGAEFLVVTLTNPAQVDPFEKEKRDKMTAEAGGMDFTYPDMRIKELGDHSGFRVMNLVEDFQEYSSENGVYLHGPDNNPGVGHWNKAGHRLAGELISSYICSELFENEKMDFK